MSGVSLGTLVAEGKVKASIHVGDLKENSSQESRKYLICGETVVFSIVLDFASCRECLQHEHASTIFGRLDAFSVELDSLPVQAKTVGLHRMRSTENLSSSMSNDSIATTELPSNMTRSKASPYVHEECRLVVPIEVYVDSEAVFESATALMKFQIFQRRIDDSLYQYIQERRTGARLLRRLLSVAAEGEGEGKDKDKDKEKEKGEEEEDAPDYPQPNIIESITSLDLQRPLYRPVQATLKYAPKSKDTVYISVSLVFNSALKTRIAVKDLDITLGDAIGRKHRPLMDLKLIRMEPVCVPLPVEMGPRSIFGCIFMAQLLPSGIPRLASEGHKIRLNALMEASDSGEIRVQFESEVNLDKLFPHHDNQGLVVSLKCAAKAICILNPFDIEIMVKNGTLADKDVSIRIPLVARSSPPSSFLDERSSPFLNNELMVDVHYSAMEPQMTAFIPLCREVHIGKLRVGECISAFCTLLPISRGKHSLRGLTVIERVEGKTYELPKVLDLIVR